MKPVDSGLLAKIIENLSLGIIIQDSAGSVVFANNCAASLFGLSKAKLMKTSADTLLQSLEASDRRILAVPSRNARKSRDVALTSKGHADGKTKWIRIKSEPVQEKGRTRYIISSLQDITREKEDEINTDMFLSAASHELKTPLASMKALSQLMELHISNKEYERLPAFLGKATGKLNALTRLINDFLDSVRINVGSFDVNPEFIEFDSFVATVIEDMRRIFKSKKIVVTGKTGRTIVADPGRVRQVLENLLRNAGRYTSESGKIAITLSSPKGAVRICVRDSGAGMDKEGVKSAFEPFNRNREKYVGDGGLGLGLYLSQHIINAHGGDISVKSRPGKGSEFCFVLPARPKR